MIIINNKINEYNKMIFSKLNNNEEVVINENGLTAKGILIKDIIGIMFCPYCGNKLFENICDYKYDLHICNNEYYFIGEHPEYLINLFNELKVCKDCNSDLSMLLSGLEAIAYKDIVAAMSL